jgi:proteasome lid subunit RPN8/RPN11
VKLLLPAPLAAQIVAEAEANAPKECCGLIEGLSQGKIFHAHRLHPARNCAAAVDRFEIAPEDHFAAARAARTRGCRLIGCYHSHPHGVAEPSRHDWDGAGEKDFLWLIAAGMGASTTLAAWLYRSGAFLPLALSVPLGADLVTSSLNERS